MKLSFYYKSGHPSVYRFLNQLCVFAALFLSFAIAGVLCLGLLDNMSNSIGLDFDCCIGSLIGIAGTLAVFLTWRKDRQKNLASRRRIIIALSIMVVVLLILTLMALSDTNYSSDLQVISVLVFVLAYWSLMTVENSSEAINFEDDNLSLSCRSFTAEVKRLQAMPLILFTFYVCWFFVVNMFWYSLSARVTLSWLLILIFAILWFYIFHKEILNSPNRLKKIAVFAGFCISIALSVLLCYMLADSDHEHVLLGPVSATPLIAISSMIFLRRNKKQVKAFFESEIRKTKFDYNMHCPVCNYNMSGLSRLRCPECGTQYSVGRIVEENEYLRRPDLWLN